MPATNGWAYIPLDERLRLQTRVNKFNGCWEWTGAKNKGYSVVGVNGKQRKAHGFLWERKNGPIPKGLELDHTCRNKGCVNPDHLELVTHQENCRRIGHVNPNGFGSKLHCKYGHVFTPENTYAHGPNGVWRACKICRRDNRKRLTLGDARWPEVLG